MKWREKGQAAKGGSIWQKRKTERRDIEKMDISTGIAHGLQEIVEKTAMRELGHTGLQNSSGGANYIEQKKSKF